jgi:magnesium transporter
MLRTIFESAEPRFVWLDLVEPTRRDLDEVAQRYGLTATAVQDCLDPEHLPKFERFNGTTFVILRAHDEKADPTADTVQALTRKVAIFWGPDFLITIHRKDQPYLSAVMEHWRGRAHLWSDGAALATDLLVDLTKAVVLSYEPPLVDSETRVDGFEAKLMSEHDVAELLRDMYHMKRRLALTKRLLWRTLSIATRLPGAGDRSATAIQDLRENAESMHFYAEELLDDVNNLLNMQLALAAHRTNDVMKVLTVFSAFFLPLTFIVGIYGMNFEHMPELPHRFGYVAVWAVMTLVSLLIWGWFRRRGWMS